MTKTLSILQVNTLDVGGGAEQIVNNLLRSYQEAGHQVCVAVGEKRGNSDAVIQIPTNPEEGWWSSLCQRLSKQLERFHGRVRGIPRLRKNLQDLAIGIDVIPRWLGMEEFHYPGSKTVLGLTRPSPEIVHLHNLHGHYFDLRVLSDLSQKAPVLLTMHDAWLLSGNCAHSFACNKWQSGCGSCPDISIYPGLSRDTTALNWKRKQQIYAQSQIYLATPSQWLMDKALSSMLAPAIIESRVIPNGVDLSTFKPADQVTARKKLSIDQDAKVILFAANGIKRNPFKDYETIHAAIERLSEVNDSKIHVIALGEAGVSEMIGNITIQYVPPIANRQEMAAYYQAADIYAHASRADTFPTSVLEAMACGIPVVATAVGGIPEQVDDGVTGFLVPQGDGAAMAKAIENILNNDQLRLKMAQASAQKAQSQFSIELQAKRYLDWYQEIISSGNTA